MSPEVEQLVRDLVRRGVRVVAQRELPEYLGRAREHCVEAMITSAFGIELATDEIDLLREHDLIDVPLRGLVPEPAKVEPKPAPKPAPKGPTPPKVSHADAVEAVRLHGTKRAAMAALGCGKGALSRALARGPGPA